MDFSLLFQKLMKLNVTGFSFDSRCVKEGEVFFALRGEKVDGHDFVVEAVQRGAKAILVDRFIEIEGVEVIVVEDVLKALQGLAQTKIALYQPKIVGITGSVGKTTTKEFLYQILSPYFSVVKPMKSYNSQITLPISILNFPLDAKIYILEMGMNQKGELDRLIEIARPDFSLLTNVSASHIGHFSSLEEIGIEKQKIFSSDADYKLMNIQAIPYVKVDGVLTYGPLGSNADFEYGIEGSDVHIVHQERKSPSVTLPFSYPHFIENVVAAFLIARKLGLGWEFIAEAAKSLVTENHRCQIVEKNGIIFFDDAYNASESSFKAAYDVCPKPSKAKKRISIVGSIGELGIHSLEAHLNVAKYALSRCDLMLCFGKETRPIVDHFKKNQRPVYYFENKQELLNILRSQAEEGDVVLVKGANSLRMWEIIEQI
jgi:UDP-N-acetylmuramoyl-tripeptide--D-alanyl-D-alanine ligase